MKDDLFARQLAKLFIAQVRKKNEQVIVNGFKTPREVMSEEVFWDSLVKSKKQNVEIK